MHKLDWNDLRYFLAVARCGSLNLAAVQLGVNHTTVSRRISALEACLHKQLFERRSSGWVITPVGERITALAQSMAEEANNIERQVLADNDELSGLLRVTAADHCLEHLAMPAISKFIRLYPDIELEVVATADELDLSAREADIALRGTDQPPPNLVGKRIARIALALYARPELKQKIEADPRTHDIPCITWVGDGHTRPAWIEQHFSQSRRIYRTTSFTVMHQMAREGIGVAQLGCVMGDPDPELQRLELGEVDYGASLWVLSHVDLRATARVRIFRDFLVEELAKKRDLIEGKTGHGLHQHASYATEED